MTKKGRRHQISHGLDLTQLKQLWLEVPRPWADSPPMAAPGNTDATWRNLLSAAQHGHESAVGDIYRRHQPAVLRYLRVCDPRGAEDIASVAWMDAARSIGNFSGNESAFTGWLFTIVRRRLVDHQRRSAREGTSSGNVEGFGPAADYTLMARTQAHEVASVIRKALPDVQAEVVLLRAVAGLSVTEVAAVVSKTEVAVRILQHRGLRKLAQTFTPESFSEEVKQIDHA